MNQKTSHIVAKEIMAALVSRDGAAIALRFDITTVELPAGQAHRLMRLLLAAVTNLPGEEQPPIGTEQAFPITQFEIGPVFPDGAVGLTLQTAPFGRQGFVMDTDTAQRIAADLRACAEQVEADRSTPGRTQ